MRKEDPWKWTAPLIQCTHSSTNDYVMLIDVFSSFRCDNKTQIEWVTQTMCVFSYNVIAVAKYERSNRRWASWMILRCRTVRPMFSHGRAVGARRPSSFRGPWASRVCLRTFSSSALVETWTINRLAPMENFKTHLWARQLTCYRLRNLSGARPWRSPCRVTPCCRREVWSVRLETIRVHSSAALIWIWMAYPLFHFLFHHAVHEIGHRVENRRGVDVIHALGPQRVGLLRENHYQTFRDLHNHNQRASQQGMSFLTMGSGTWVKCDIV